MEINATVYLVTCVTMYGNKIPNSGQILKGKVIEILATSVTVEIQLGNNKTTITEVNTSEYYKTFALALNALEPLVNDKVKFLDEKDYTGEDMPVLFEPTN